MEGETRFALLVAGVAFLIPVVHFLCMFIVNPREALVVFFGKASDKSSI